MYNIYTGLFWFIFPCMCVITNDCFAYVFGMLFGRTKLISISPNKTVEGFVGGGLMTILWSFIASGYLIQFHFWVCP